MKVWKEVRGWGLSIIVGFVLSVIIGIFVIQPYRVDGHSMEPTLNDTQRIFAWKTTHTLNKLPAYEDIVIIDSRVDRKRTIFDDIKENPIIQLLSGDEAQEIFYVKRVIGLPGDTIEIKEGHLYRNGKEVNEPYIKEPMNAGIDQSWIIPEDHVFVMGDNRNHSNDSRSIGPIPLTHVMGVDDF